MAELAAQYIELYAKVHKKSWQRDAWMLTKAVVPVRGCGKRLISARNAVECDPSCYLACIMLDSVGSTMSAGAAR